MIVSQNTTFVKVYVVYYDENVFDKREGRDCLAPYLSLL